MTTMKLINDFNQTETQCNSCDVIFTLFWNRDGIHDKIEYCPFCGDEVDEIIEEFDEIEDD